MAATLNLGKKAFLVHMAYLRAIISIYLAAEAQIPSLVNKKINILFESLDFVDVFLKKLVAKLFKHFDINKYLIHLGLGKQLPYSPIYSLEPVKLEILKTFIKINLANSFIRPFYSLTNTFILFVKKLNNSFCLNINY